MGGRRDLAEEHGGWRDADGEMGGGEWGVRAQGVMGCGVGAGLRRVG